MPLEEATCEVLSASYKLASFACRYAFSYSIPVLQVSANCLSSILELYKRWLVYDDIAV